MKNINYKILFLVLFTTIFNLQFLFGEDSDTIKTYYMKTIVVTATRSEILLEKSPSFTEIISSDRIKKLNGSTAGEILQYNSGIYIKDYGGVSALKTLSLRGTGSENNLFLINGSRVNNFQNGLVDLSLYPSDYVEKIEVVHGGNTALFGSDAVGSVINILTNSPSRDLKLKLNLSNGSFNYNKLVVSLSNGYKNINGNFSFIREYGRENYKYKNPVYNEILERQNNGFSRNSFYTSLEYLGKKVVIKNFWTYNQLDRRLPGSLSYPSTSASQNDKNLSSQLILKYIISSKIQFDINSSWLHLFQRYREPAFSIESFSKNNHFSLNPQLLYKINDFNKILFGIELVEASLEGVDYANKVTRSQRSIFLSGDIMFPTSLSYLHAISVYPIMRFDNFNSNGNEFLPKLGFNIETIPGLFLQTSISKNYRIPTLNDLFYKDPWGNRGNPDLKPEYSTNFDAGINYSPHIFDKFNIGISYFYINTKDKIVWKEIEPFVYSAVNIDRTLIKGIVTRINYRMKNFEIETNYTYSDGRKVNDFGVTSNKQLIYTPRNIWKGILSYDLGILSINLYHIVVDKRYTDEENTKSVAGYQVTNGNVVVMKKYGQSLISLKLEINNMFNKSYQIIYDYPMPFRSYRISLGFEY